MALALFGMLGISTDSLFIRMADVDGFELTLWVGIFSAVALAVVIRIRDGVSLLAVVRSGGWPLWFGGILQALSTSAFVLAVTKTSVANVVVIIASAPIVAAVLATVVLKESSTRRVWLAAVAVLFGVVLVVSGSFGGGSLTGDALALAAIVMFGMSLVLLRRFPDINRMALVALGGIGMAAIALATMPTTLIDHAPKTWIAIALMGLVFGPAARVMIAQATNHLPAAEVGLFAPVETVAASAWAWLFFAEAPPATTIIGGVVIVAAVLLGTRQPRSAQLAL